MHCRNSIRCEKLLLYDRLSVIRIWGRYMQISEGRCYNILVKLRVLDSDAVESVKVFAVHRQYNGADYK